MIGWKTQMGQNFFDHGSTFNCRDGLRFTSALGADLDIDIEDAL